MVGNATVLSGGGSEDRITELSIVCYAPTMITTNGIWQGDDPLKYSLPLFILQLTIIVLTTRLIPFLLKPLKQPRVVAEILVRPLPLSTNINFGHIISS